MNIKVKVNGIFVNQFQYTEKILKRFEFKNSNSVSIPMERGMITDEKTCE